MSDQIKLVFHNAFQNREQFEMSCGSRPWHVFLILTEGSFVFHINGEEYCIEKDEIAFFPQNTYFERKVVSPISFQQFGFCICQDTEHTQMLRAGRLPIPHTHVRAITEVLDTSSQYLPRHQTDIHLQVLQQIILENHLYGEKRRMPIAKRDADVDYVIGYMTEHLDEKIKIEELAGTLHLSRVALFGKFKKSMGCSPSDFLIKLRMQYAKHLLLEGNMRIGEIASRCGYENAYYFSNAFKKAYAMSPARYRQYMLGTNAHESENPMSSNWELDTI